MISVSIEDSKVVSPNALETMARSKANNDVNEDVAIKSKGSNDAATDADFAGEQGTDTSSYTGNDEDERRLRQCGYKQEFRRIFSGFTSFGLTSSMVSILLGCIPLYSYELQSGGSATFIWSWLLIGVMTFSVVCALAEICSVFPTMGALYYWSFVLGGSEWGPFAGWVSGWCNLLGQIAGVASGAYAGAETFNQIILLQYGTELQPRETLGVFAALLVIAGTINTFADTMLMSLCYISMAWQICGVIIIVIWTLVSSPTLQPVSAVFGNINNETGFDSIGYVVMLGSLAAASTFTGYDTGAHVAEETKSAHNSAPSAMTYSVLNALLLGLLLIIGMNFSIQGDISSIASSIDDPTNPLQGLQVYTIVWLQAVGPKPTIFFLAITLVAIECSNCANLTSAARMVFAFARDGALPLSKFWHHIDRVHNTPTRAIFLCVIISFALGTPGLTNPAVLSALFSLTATGLYSSYLIPILLRITVSRKTFVPAEFNLGIYSLPNGIIAVTWCIFMVILLCLPSVSPITVDNINYSPLMLGAVLVYAIVMWYLSARHWFKQAMQDTQMIYPSKIPGLVIDDDGGVGEMDMRSTVICDDADDNKDYDFNSNGDGSAAGVENAHDGNANAVHDGNDGNDGNDLGVVHLPHNQV